MLKKIGLSILGAGTLYPRGLSLKKSLSKPTSMWFTFPRREMTKA
ncbi:hypothetical protein [Pseudomonas sp. NPDC089534]